MLERAPHLRQDEAVCDPHSGLGTRISCQKVNLYLELGIYLHCHGNLYFFLAVFGLMILFDPGNL